jgi:hypothetical protein
MLNSFLFSQAIEEIETVFGSMKLTSNQMEGWFSRLSHFDDDDLRMAIHRIIKTGHKPSFITLQSELFNAKRQLHSEEPILSGSYREEGGKASPFTDELIAHSRTHMQGLIQMMKMGEVEREATRLALKESWLMGFNELPDVVSQEEIEQMARLKSVEELERVGVLNKQYPTAKLVVPLLEVEQQYRSKEPSTSTDMVSFDSLF